MSVEHGVHEGRVPVLVRAVHVDVSRDVLVVDSERGYLLVRVFQRRVEEVQQAFFGQEALQLRVMALQELLQCVMSCG